MGGGGFFRCSLNRPSLVVLADVVEVEPPDLAVVVRQRHPLVARDDVLVDRQDRLGVHADPSNLGGAGEQKKKRRSSLGNLIRLLRYDWLRLFRKKPSPFFCE